MQPHIDLNMNDSLKRYALIQHAIFMGVLCNETSRNNCQLFILNFYPKPADISNFESCYS